MADAARIADGSGIFKRGARRGSCEFNTVAFVGKDDGYFEQLKQIAADSGGTFRFVAEMDLEREAETRAK